MESLVDLLALLLPFAEAPRKRRAEHGETRLADIGHLMRLPPSMSADMSRKTAGNRFLQIAYTRPVPRKVPKKCKLVCWRTAA